MELRGGDLRHYFGCDLLKTLFNKEFESLAEFRTLGSLGVAT